MRNWIAKFALLALFLATPAVLLAQDSSSMTGVVTDVTGAIVPDTAVILSNRLTGVKYTQVTDKLGSYRFPNVPTGEGYTVTFNHTGFASSVVKDVTLQVGITRTQNATLVPGANQSIEVSGSNAEVTLNTTDASIGNNIDVQLLNDLPVYDRTNGVRNLFTLQPGVEFVAGAVAGARTDQTEATVDGLDVSDISTGQFADLTSPAPIDSVEQFTGTIAGLNSSIGTGSGGQFQLVTKHGINRFYGNINEYHRDTTTEANTWFNNLNGLPRTPLIRNQFGGNIGGPIFRNKLFFFFDYAGSRIRQSGTSEPIVPLSNLLSTTPTLNYINSGSGCNDQSRINTQKTCITALSATQVASLDPAGAGFSQGVMNFLASRYPVANDLTQGDGVNTGGYRFTYPSPDNQDTYVGRIDYNLTPTQRVFGRFTINRRNTVESAPVFPTDPLTSPFIDRTYSYVVSHVWTLGANKVNQFYYGDTIEKYNFPVLYAPTGGTQYGFSGLATPYSSGGQARRNPIPLIRDDFNWQRGSHSMAFGGTFKFIKTHDTLINNFISPSVGLGGTGSVFNGGLDAGVRPSDIYVGTAGTATTDYDQLFASTLGIIADVSTNFNYNNKGAVLPAGSGAQRVYRYFETELYAGDTWKVTPRLTVSYGVRYQLYSVPYETRGNESVPVNAATGKPIYIDDYIQARLANISNTTPTGGLPLYAFVLGGKANKGPNLYAPSYHEFAPRAAFAYSPNPRTVVNGSAGVVYDRTVINAITFLQDQNSFLFANSNTYFAGGTATSLDNAVQTAPRIGSTLSYNTSINPPALPVTVPFVPFVSNGIPFGLSQNAATFYPAQNLKDPYSIAINAGIQQELPGHMILKLNYAGRLGRRLLASADASQVINVPDFTGKSSQTLSDAFAGMTAQLRAGVKIAALTPQPWFEDVLNSAVSSGIGFPSNTALAAAMLGQLATRGDIGDSIVTLAQFSANPNYQGFLPANIGSPSQFAINEVLTNKGSSNYHALLLTLHKNLSQGLEFDFNYTWAHSIDNTSLIANSNPLTSANPTGLICDILKPRACRGNSDFDVRQEISSDFLYNLPFGRGRAFLGGAPQWLDEAVGGWSLSAIPRYRTGLAVNVLSDAFNASSENGDPAIFLGNPGDLKVKVNKASSGTVYAFAGGAAGAAKVLNEFRGPLGLEYGQRNLSHGAGALYFDAGLGKTFAIIEQKLNLQFRADAFNVLNHANFALPNVNIINNASNFGQITGISTAGPGQDGRVAQFSLRLEF